MHRTSLRELLQSYKPTDKSEIISRALMLDFVNDNPHCFERSSLKGHITGSAWLLNHDLSKVLLMHHSKLNLWCQPGGHCDGDADVLRVAIKEAQEESGINNILPLSTEIFDIDIHSIPAFADTPAHFHYDVRFMLKAQYDEPAVGNKESKALAWFGKEEALLPNNSESILRMFRKWLASN